MRDHAGVVESGRAQPINEWQTLQGVVAAFVLALVALGALNVYMRHAGCQLLQCGLLRVGRPAMEVWAADEGRSCKARNVVILVRNAHLTLGACVKCGRKWVIVSSFSTAVIAAFLAWISDRNSCGTQVRRCWQLVAKDCVFDMALQVRL